MGDEKPRQLSRHETHDLGMIIKERAKVLKAHAEEQAAACLADFETNMAAVYKFDDDEVWKKAVEEAEAVVSKSRETIAKRCKELGIPPMFAPSVALDWRSRGENMVRARRVELRHAAKAQIEAMLRASITKIEKQSLDLRTQVVAMGIYTPDAKMFLESLAPIEETMRRLDFKEVERKFDAEKKDRMKLIGRFEGGGYDLG